MMRSMGSTYFTVGPALLGLVVHMTVGIVFGVIFELGASRLGVRGAAAVAGGIVYGTASPCASSAGSDEITVDLERRPGDVGRIIAQEQRGRPGDLLWARLPPQRHAGEELAFGTLPPPRNSQTGSLKGVSTHPGQSS